MSVDKYVDYSFGLYIQAAEKFGVVPVDKKEYRDLLFSAVTALKECPEVHGEYPYVFVKVSDLYMKAKKKGENLDISYMDKDAFNLVTNFKQEGV